jgi:hypothetical protein
MMEEENIKQREIDMFLWSREAQLQTQVELTRKVLLGVIVESRIDWSNDKKLTNLVLKLGDDFDVVGRKQLLRELKQHDDDIDLPDAVKEESFMSDTQSVTTDGMSMDQIIV